MAVISRDRWRVLEPLLDEALELSDEQRIGWLEALRLRSPDVAADLTSILSGEKAADQRSFLVDPPQWSLEGLEMGAYTLERLLGHGGMGSVWLARRTDGRFEGRAAGAPSVHLVHPTDPHDPTTLVRRSRPPH